MEDSVLIVGSGAMACLFASRLAAGGVDVTMLGTWAGGLEALRRNGVRVVRGDDGEDAYPVRATSMVADCADAGLALVLVKSWQTERAGKQLADCLAPDGVALTLQNGLGNRETLAALLGESRVALGVTTSGATLLGPGEVRPGGEGIVSLGEHPRVADVTGLLRQAGFEVEVVEDADDLLWSKLVINAAINPLGALLQCPNGALVSRPSARALMGLAAGEAADVAAAAGRTLTYSDPVGTVEAVAERTSSNRCSMLQDVARNAPTEIDAINGAIVAAGEQAGVATPVNRALWLLVRAWREGRAG
jgi:2-dehydropantoate 2-reductase